MNQDQIVQLLLDAARGVVGARFGGRAETLWPSLEPGLRGAAGKLVGDAIEAAKRADEKTEDQLVQDFEAEVGAGAMLVAPPRTPNQIRLAEEAAKFRQIERAALDYLDKRTEEGKVTPYFRLVLRDGILSYPSSINSDLVGRISKKEHGGAYKKLSKEAKQELFRVANEVASILREGSDSLIEAQFAARKEGFGYEENPLVAAQKAETKYRDKIAEYVRSQIGPETAYLLTARPEIAGSISLGEVKDARGLASRVAELASKYKIRVNELANQAAARMAGEKDPARVADAYHVHGVTPREMFDQERIFRELDGATRELESRGVPVDFSEYRAAIARLKREIAKAEETHAKARSEREEQRRASLEKAEKEERARIEARPDFAHPYVENFEKAARQAEKKIKAQEKRHDFFALRPLQSKRLGVFPTDEEIRSKLTQDDEDRIEKRAAKFFENLENAKRRLRDPTLTTKAHSDGLYAYVYDGANHLARFVTNKQKEAIPDAFQNMLIRVGASSQRDIMEVDGKSLSWLAQIVLAADKGERQKGDLGIATEVGYEKVFAVDDKMRESVIRQTLPARFRGDSAVAGESVEVYVPAEQVRDALVGYEGTAYLSLPSPQEFRKLSWKEKQDLSDYLIIYREDGEAHLMAAKVVARVEQD